MDETNLAAQAKLVVVETAPIRLDQDARETLGEVDWELLDKALRDGIEGFDSVCAEVDEAVRIVLHKRQQLLALLADLPGGQALVVAGLGDSNTQGIG